MLIGKMGILSSSAVAIQWNCSSDWRQYALNTLYDEKIK